MESNTDGGIQNTDSGIQNFFMDSYSTGNSIDKISDPYGVESNGTVKFIGGGGGGGIGVPSENKFDFHTIKANNSSGGKIRTEHFSRNELVNMLCHFEGELQARDIVIAALRNERVKQLIHNLRTKQVNDNDPNSALFRDKIASVGNLVSRQSSTTVVQAEMEVRAIIEQQMESLYQMVTKQRATQNRMVNCLTDSLENNQRMRHELEEEKRKHEHDTAQGDDITYGLEMERTKLKQELESERNQRKKLEKDLKKLQENLEFEKGRQKQIVLLLLAERKKIIMKYIEERKRSEDLAQILSEEKQRSDSIAEGLEEESKKSLRMEAELEKQTNAFDNERKILIMNSAIDDKRIKELEAELAQLKNAKLIPALPGKTRNITSDSIGAPSSVVNVAKIVQPTATVSSVPVCGPTTGIARSVNSTSLSGLLNSTAKLTRKISQPTTQITNNNTSGSVLPITATSQQLSQNIIATIGIAEPLTTTIGGGGLQQQQQHCPQLINDSDNFIGATITNLTAAAGSSSVAAAITLTPTPSSQLSSGGTSSVVPITSTMNSNNLKNIVCSNSGVSSGNIIHINHITGITTAIIPPVSSTNPILLSGLRGAPPPIPPNKPVVPPKREPSLPRLGSTTTITTNNIK